MADFKTNKILVMVILDRSGSMSKNRAGTISGYNEYINGLRADKDSDYVVSLIQFDAPIASPELTVSYEQRALVDVPELTEAGYEPRGNTPLYDAIGECIRRTDPKDRAVIACVITDGEENASHEFTKDSVKKLIAEKEAEGWTFAFLGANIDSYAVGGAIGVAAINTANYTVGNEGVLYSNLAASTISRSHTYKVSGSLAAQSQSFFTDQQRTAMEQPQPITTTTGAPCPHGRASWHSCPHCLGLNSSISSGTGSIPGGRPAAPPPFRKPKAKQRSWKVTKS